MKIVYTTGVFDILHRGHLNVLRKASALGDKLVVGVQTDEGAEQSKGKRPVLTLEERKAQLMVLPFVDSVLEYTRTEQRFNYMSVEADVIVQGDDWLHSGDRTEEIDYIKEHGLQLVLIPRTEGISSTEIRKRVTRTGRNDERFLLEHVQVRDIDDVSIYEDYDEEKVVKLMCKILDDQVFFNPISIVREGVVIDGVNRLEALKRIHARWVPVVEYNYNDVDLVGNVHFIKDGKKTRMSEFCREEGERVDFPARTPEEILEAARNNERIPNGETFHRVPQRVIRLPVPLKDLMGDKPPDLKIQERIDEGKIRFYQTSVYICDEY